MEKKERKAERPKMIIRPVENDTDFIEKLEYRDPIEKASIWLHKHLVKIIRLIDANRAWYAGEKTAEEPERRLSEMFETSQNTLCNRFRYYGEQLVRYQPGQVPRDVIERDYRCACILVAQLFTCSHDTPLFHRLRHVVDEFWMWLTEKDNFECADYAEELQKKIGEIVHVFGSLSEYFALREERLMQPSEKDEDVARQTLRIMRETQSAVQRMDARDKRFRQQARLQFDVQTQDKAYALWEAGRSNPSVKQLAQNRRKTTYADVFAFYVRDFKALGLINAEMLKACLGVRSDRLRRGKAE